jgi:hypothetical protein
VQALIERILSLYAEQLLMSLPGVHVSSRCVTELVTRYREATKEMVTAARALHRAEGHASDGDLLPLRIEAEATASVWEATHRLMVAVHVDLMCGNGIDAHPLEIVLVAEMHVEQLVGDVEADEI